MDEPEPTQTIEPLRCLIIWRAACAPHPANMHPIIKRDQWTMEAIAEQFRTDLAKRQLPLGPATIKVEVVT